MSSWTDIPLGGNVSHHFTMMDYDHKFYSLEDYAKMKEDKKNRPLEVILKESVEQKNLGNAAFQKENFAEALDRYHAALDYLPTPKLDDKTGLWKEDESKELSDLRATICNNVAAARIKRGEYEDAIGYVTNTLRTNGFQNNVKALYRRALSYENLGDYDKAQKDYHHVLEVEPNNEEAREAIARIQKLTHSKQLKEHELAHAESVAYNIRPHPHGKKDLSISQDAAFVVKMSVPCGTGFSAMALLDTELSHGIYLIQIKITELMYRSVVGVYAHSKSMPFPDFDHYSNSLGYQSDGRTDHANNRYYGNNPWKKGSLVTMEVDVRNRTLHFLVNQILQPVSITQLPPSLRFYIEMWEESNSFVIASFKRLPASSITPATPRAPCYEGSGYNRQPRSVAWGYHEDNFFR